MDPEALKDLHDFACALARKCGSYLRKDQERRRLQMASTGQSLDTREKDSSVDIVTEVDEDVEKMIREGVLARYPDHAFIGEESYSAGEEKRYLLDERPTWIVDPIDGTVNMVHMFPMTAISIGFCFEKIPVVGVVFAPFMGYEGTLYSSCSKQGAWMSESTSQPPIPLPILSPPLPLPSNAPKGCLYFGEWGKDRRDIEGGNLSKKVNGFVNLATEVGGRGGRGGHVHGIRSLGSATMGMCYVAAGQGDVLFEAGCWEWDICASVAILLETGGLLVDGNPPEGLEEGSEIPLAGLGGRSFFVGKSRRVRFRALDALSLAVTSCRTPLSESGPGLHPPFNPSPVSILSQRNTVKVSSPVDESVPLSSSRPSDASLSTLSSAPSSGTATPRRRSSKQPTGPITLTKKMFGGRNSKTKYTPLGSGNSSRFPTDPERGGRRGSNPPSVVKGGGRSWKLYGLLAVVLVGGILVVASRSGFSRGSGNSSSDAGKVYNDEDYDIHPNPGFPDSLSGGMTDLEDDSGIDYSETASNRPSHGGSSSPEPLDEEVEDIAPVHDTKPPVKTKPVPVPVDDEDDEDLPTAQAEEVGLLESKFCTKPAKGHQLIQYALMIDAGSQGSRIHVYKFSYCTASPALEGEVFKQITPGLSSYGTDPVAAAQSLEPLMKAAMESVPPSLRGCTPVAVKATAGLRLLGEEKSSAILSEVERYLKEEYPFPVVEKDGVVVMDGKDEGVYAWITANYLLSKIGEGVPSTTSTLAVMDLGGASTQIVFEPKFAKSSEVLAEGDHKYELTFGGKDYTLYQHSYLGYGLMRARRSIHHLVSFTWSFAVGKDWSELVAADGKYIEIGNPCLGEGENKIINLDPPGFKGDGGINVTMVGTSGGFVACNRLVELVMAKDAICEVKPCSFNGVYQPSLLDTFPASGQFLALSYFYDRISPLFPETSVPVPFSLPTLANLAKVVCGGKSVWSKHFAGNKRALKELEKTPEYCLDLTFMHGLLGLGYEITPERDILIEKQLNSVELGWALGAGLALLDQSSLKCVA